MPQMKTDFSRLKKYVKTVSDSLAQSLNITPEQGMEILNILETKDYFTLEPPQIEDTPAPATALFPNVSPSTLGMTSYKVGNIPGKLALNLHEKWKIMISFIPAAYLTAAEIGVVNPIVVVCKVLPLFYAASELCSISFSENGTAIIMALQNCGPNVNYSASEQQCFQDANMILMQYNYKPMEENTFQREIDILLKYGCIDEKNGALYLREKVVGSF